MAYGNLSDHAYSGALSAAVVRFVKAVVVSRDDYYNQHIVKQNHLQPLVDLFFANGKDKYNLVNSAIISIFDYIKKVLFDMCAALAQGHVKGTSQAGGLASSASMGPTCTHARGGTKSEIGDSEPTLHMGDELARETFEQGKWEDGLGSAWCWTQPAWPPTPAGAQA